MDQIALDSAPGGAAMPLASPTTLAAPAGGRLAHRGRRLPDGHRAPRDGAAASRRPRGPTPFDLILGESINKGWTATVDGGPGLGSPVLIDAFANGWRIDPVALAPFVHHGTLSVTLVWTPQRSVDWALIISAATVLACVVLALWPRRRRRRARGAGW